MRPPARPPVPSALDGYQRLRRGPVASARAASEVGPLTMEAATPTRRRVLRRMVGAARLAGLVAVLAVIVGASVGLASSGPSEPRDVRATAATGPLTVPAPVGPTRALHAAAAAKATHVSKATHAPKATPVATAAKAPAVAVETPSQSVVASPRAAAPRAQLPYTGDRLSLAVLLAGAGLVLLGMLVQIAGQPLPSAAASRARARDTAAPHA